MSRSASHGSPEGRIRQGSAHLFSDRSIIEHLGAGRPLTGITFGDNLRIGEDAGTRFITFRDEATNALTEQLLGTVDDVVVARRALSDREVQALSLGSGGTRAEDQGAAERRAGERGYGALAGDRARGGVPAGGVVVSGVTAWATRQPHRP